MYKNVYVIGVFDLFHRGHVELLKKAKSLGKNLIVAVNGDVKVAGYKKKPVYCEVDRLEIIKSCRFVDEAFIINEYDQKGYIEKYAINVIIHGNDWKRERYLKQICITEEYLKKQNVELLLVPYTSGLSTTQVIDRIKAIDNLKPLSI